MITSNTTFAFALRKSDVAPFREIIKFIAHHSLALDVGHDTEHGVRRAEVLEEKRLSGIGAVISRLKIDESKV